MKIRNSPSNRTQIQKAKLDSPRLVQRRLLSLCVALVLVVMLMQRAGDPEVYRRIFMHLGMPIETPRGTRINPHPDSLPVPQPVSVEQGDYDAIISALTPQQRIILTKRLAALRHPKHNGDSDGDTSGDSDGDTSGDEPKVVSDAQQAREYLEQSDLDALGATLASAARETQFADPSSIENAMLSDRPETLSADQKRQLDQLQRALDKTYFRTIEDGTVWNAGDFYALYRMLERIDRHEPYDDPLIDVGAVSLLEQSVIYRARHVRIFGHAAMVQHESAKPNPFGIEQYAMVWVRPIDGSECPIALCTPQLPPELSDLDPTTPQSQWPMVEAEGIFLKRYLYRSVGDYEQAPLLVASLRTLDEVASGQAMRGAARGDQTTQVGFWVIMAAGIGLLISGSLWLSARKHDRYLKRLRRQGKQPSSEFFESLDQMQ